MKHPLDALRAGKLPSLITDPPHYMHPTIDSLEARFVIENLPYHVATAAAYLWRCGRKQGVDPLDDLAKAMQHLQFEIERLRKYRLSPVYAHSLPTIGAPGIQSIIEPFPYNIATALRYLLGMQIPWDLSAAMSYIDFEIDRRTPPKLREMPADLLDLLKG